MATLAATTAVKMKAVRIHKFGGPEVMEYEDAPIPAPKEKELLVRLHAAGVNPVDWKIRQGLFAGPPLPEILGSDFAGIVEDTGPDVREFRPGDPVFGLVAEDSGSYAQYAVAPVSSVARRPAGIDETHAAALPTAALTAWQSLFDKAQLKPRQTILIHGAAGGVGGFAVQFAKWKDAIVLATASSRNGDYVRQLGADTVIDYGARRFEEVARDVDVVFDTIGGDTQERSFGVLKPGGILVSIVQPPDKARAQARGVRAEFLSSSPRGDQLAQIASLVAGGEVKVHIDSVYPLDEARRALELSQSGHVRGKIVLLPGPIEEPDSP